MFFILCLCGCSHNIKESLIYSNAIKSVVELKSEKSDLVTYGTAIYIGNNLYITNAHVVTYKSISNILEFENYYFRSPFGKNYQKAELIYYDNNLDLAILASRENFCTNPIRMSVVNSIITGNTVYTVGNTQNQGISISRGIVSNSRVNIIYSGITREMIASDAYISEGNSGGALINVQGELLGITTLRLKDKLGNTIYGMGYSIPIDIVETFISDFNKTNTTMKIDT